VPGGDLGLDVAPDLGVSVRLDVAAGLTAPAPLSAAAEPDYRTGVQAVGR
jgi:hypothetical protein